MAPWTLCKTLNCMSPTRAQEVVDCILPIARWWERIYDIQACLYPGQGCEESEAGNTGLDVGTHPGWDTSPSGYSYSVTGQSHGGLNYKLVIFWEIEPSRFHGQVQTNNNWQDYWRVSAGVGWTGIGKPLGHIVLFLWIDFDRPLCCSCNADVATLKATPAKRREQ